jgi:Mce-associated membrane protein
VAGERGDSPVSDVETDPTPATQSVDHGGESSRQLSIVAVVVAAVIVVLLAVVTVLVSSRTASRHRQQSTAAATYLAGPSALAAEAAAATETRATLTYSYKTLPADFAAAEKGLTPRFRASYAHTTSTSVTPLATKYHAISSATVSAGGVSAASANSATVLLFVDQTVQNTQLPRPRLDRSRIKVSMLRINGQWLVDHLSPI